MPLTEKNEEQLEILPNGIIQVRNARIIMDDGIEISKSYNRHVVDVDDNTANESPRLKAIATVLWTQEVKAARLSEKAAAQAGGI